MSKRLRIIIPLLVVLIIGVLVIGALGYILFSRKSNNDEVVFAATEVGTPVGPNVTKNIGPAGGTIASPDGRLTLTIPQNALTEMISFSIQPISNKAGNGIGSAYRLEPNGKTFTTPLNISVHYDDHDLEGTVPEAFSIAFQDQEGAWHEQTHGKLDKNANTLTITATHFTDYAFSARLRVIPTDSKIHVGESELIQLIQCERSTYMDEVLRRRSVCIALPTNMDKWKLRGEGTLKKGRSADVVYTAPARKPSPNIVWVTAEVEFEQWDSHSGRMTKVTEYFAARVTIVDRGYRATGSDGPTTYSGTVCSLDKEFTVIGHNGPLDLTFKFTPSGDGRAGTGNLGGSVSVATWTGDGPYTIEGFNGEKPKIVLVTHQTVSGKISGSGTFHIDLVPLDTDECNKP
jgi:hypothetical protein